MFDRHIKNLVIGSNRLKGLVIESSIVPRLMQLIHISDNTNHQLAKEVVLTIASLAKGTEEHLKVLIDSGIVGLLLENTKSNDSALVEACLRALRTIFNSSEAPIDLIYDKNSGNDSNSQPIIADLLSLATNSQSFVNKECIANIMAFSCQVFICMTFGLQLTYFRITDSRTSKYSQ